MVTPRTALFLLVGILLALAGCARERVAVTPPGDAASRLAGVDWGAAERIDVTLDEYDFAPEKLALRQGRPYLLRLANTGGSEHDFTSPTLFSAVAVRPDGSAAQAASGGTIELAPGETVDLYVLPLRPGRYEYWCDHGLHATFGMTGEATVE